MKLIDADALKAVPIFNGAHVRGADWRETHDTGRTTISNSRLF